MGPTILLFWAVLAAGPSVQGPNVGLATRAPSQPSGVDSWATCADGSLNFPCAGTTTAVKPSGQAITFSRNYTDYCCEGATCVVVAANTPCVTSKGMEVFGTTSNIALQSQTIATGTSFTSPWSVVSDGVTALPTTSADQATAPDGTLTADALSFPAINGSNLYSVLRQSFAGTAVPYTLSLWARTASGTGTLETMITDGGTNIQLTQAPLTTTWSRVTVTKTLTANTWYINIGPNTLTGTGQPPNQPALSVYLWGVQVEAHPYAGPYRATSGSPYSGPATVVSRPVTLANPARWAIGIKYNTNSFGAATQYLLNLGSGANSAYLGGTYFGVFDSSATQRYSAWTPPASGAHTAVIASDASGNMQLWSDDVPVSLSLAGAGTGAITSLPAALSVGNAANGTNQINGTVSKTCQGPTYSSVAACLRAP